MGSNPVLVNVVTAVKSRRAVLLGPPKDHDEEMDCVGFHSGSDWMRRQCAACAGADRLPVIEELDLPKIDVGSSHMTQVIITLSPGGIP